MNAGGIVASVLVHVGLFSVITRTEAPLTPKVKTAIRVVETKPEPPPEPPPPPPPPPKAEPEPPKPKPKPKAAPAAEPSTDAPPPAKAPLDLGNMSFTNDSGSGPSLPTENLGRDPNEPPAPKPKPRAVEKVKDDKPKPRNEPAACAEELVKATATNKVPIEYPAAAREQGIEGQLVLRAQIGADGKVGTVEIVRSAGALIDEPAVAALKRWTFTPATRCGKPTESTFTIARRFEIGT